MAYDRYIVTLCFLFKANKCPVTIHMSLHGNGPMRKWITLRKEKVPLKYIHAHGHNMSSIYYMH